MATERINVVVTEKGSRVVKRRLAGVGTTASKSAIGVNLLRSALIGIGGALVLAQTVRTLANFGQAMSTVMAVSGATESQWKSLTDTARKLGAVTRFTATQAAEGLVELARAGFTVDEQLSTIQQTLQLAQAGALDLGRAAEITVGTLRGFRLEVDQANRVTDVLAFAANAASTDVNQLGEAMKFVAPIAAGMGVSLEETVAALQTLADAQLKSAMGGTGLRQVMASLESPSEKTRKLLKGMGVETNEVRITTVGLTAALERLADAGVGTGMALEIFGRRGGPAFEVMAKAVPKIKAARAALLKASGTTKRIADIMDDNLNGALLRVKSAYESVQLAFGYQGGSDILTQAANTIAGALRFLANHIEIVEGAFVVLAIMAIPKLIAALVMLSGALSIIALGMAIGALVSYRHEIEMSSDSVVTLGDYAAATWERIRAGAVILLDLLKSALPWLADAWASMFGDLELSLEGFIKGGARALDWWVGLWTGVINVIKALWNGLGPALLDATISMMNGIIGIVEAGLNAILKAFGALATKLPGRFGRAFEGLGEGQILPRIENVAEAALEGLDKAVVDGYAQGFESVTVFEDAVNDLFDRAEVIAKERLANQALAGERDGPTVPTGDDAPTSQGQSRAFEISLDLVQEQIDLLRMSAAARQVEIELRKQEILLAKKGIDLTEIQRGQLGVELERLQIAKQVSVALDSVRGSELNLAVAQAELNEQVAAGNITLAQAKQAYALLQDEVNETSTTVGAGFSRGFNEIGRTITDFASQAEKTLVNAFNSAEDALVSFVTTGQIDFKSMVDSILGDLTRLVARILLVKAIEGATGSPISALFGGGMAGGGAVEPGKFYMTGEKGPELFSPSVPGQIVPNSQVKKAVGPGGGDGGGEGNVTIINVSSREEALAAIGSSEGERLIVNVMAKTKRETS